MVSMDVLHEIFLRFSLEDLKVLRRVCRLFYTKTIRYFTYTVLRVSFESEIEPDFDEFCKLSREFVYPYLYQNIVVVKQEQQFLEPFKTEYPILAAFTAYGALPKWVDTLQLRCIAHSSISPIDMYTCIPACKRDLVIHIPELLCSKNELPELKALFIRDPRFCTVEMGMWVINRKLQHLSIFSESVWNARSPDGHDFDNLKVLITKLEHGRCPMKDLPSFPNITKCVIHLSEKDCHPLSIELKKNLGGFKNFYASQLKSLKNLEVYCSSSTRLCCYHFGLPTAGPHLRKFVCNATPDQVQFVVYGTTTYQNVFTPGCADWYSNLEHVKIRKDFYWWVEVENNVFEKCFFEAGTLNQDVVEYFDSETTAPSPPLKAIEY